MQVGDWGVALRVTIRSKSGVVFPIDDATTLQILLVKPGGACLTKTAVFVGDGSESMAATRGHRLRVRLRRRNRPYDVVRERCPPLASRTRTCSPRGSVPAERCFFLPAPCRPRRLATNRIKRCG